MGWEDQRWLQALNLMLWIAIHALSLLRPRDEDNRRSPGSAP